MKKKTEELNAEAAEARRSSGEYRYEKLTESQLALVCDSQAAFGGEYRYEKLTEAQRALVRDSQAAFGRTENANTNLAEALFAVDEAGAIVGYREPTMFMGKEPAKWGPVLGLDTGEALPILKENRESRNAGKEETTGEWVGRVMGDLDRPPAPGAAMVQGDLRMVPYDLIDRCALNPRKTFHRERLDELKQSFREHGFVKEMSHLWLRPHPTTPGRYELVDGERTWTVIGELIGEEMFGGLMPAMISELSDAQVLEYALLNAMQREELSPMEEAGAVCLRMQLARETGEILTNRDLAKHLGCDENRIRRALLLHGLSGTLAGDEVERGLLPVVHGERLARVASPAKRDELTKRILNPSDKRGVLPLATLEQWIKDEVHVDLRKAEFDLLNPDIVPLKMVDGMRQCGGACAEKLGAGTNSTKWECPFVEVMKGGAMCTNPDCFRAKQAVEYETWCFQQQFEGFKTMPAEEAARMWDDSGKRVVANAGLVEIEAEPEEWELREGAMEDGKMPNGKRLKWKALIKGKPVEVLALKDRRGAEHFLVNREQAKAAAVENGHDIFRGKPGAAAAEDSKGQMEDGKDGGEGDPRIEQAAEDVKAEAERAAAQAKRERESRIEDRCELLLNRSVVEKTRGLKKLGFDFWRLILAPMAEAVKENGNVLPTCLALGLSEADVDGTSDNSGGMTDEGLGDWLNETMRATPEVHLPSMAIILARHMLYASEIEQWMKLAGKTFGVDAKEVRARAKTQVDAELALEAERAEIASGIVWMNQESRKAGKEDFEWALDGYCTSPNLAAVKMPKGVKHGATLTTARMPKGWAFGFELTLGNKALVTTYPNRNEAIYDNEALAIRAALLALLKAMEDNSAPEAARGRVEAYIAGMGVPETAGERIKRKWTTKKAKGTKKKGGAK